MNHQAGNSRSHYYSRPEEVRGSRGFWNSRGTSQEEPGECHSLSTLCSSARASPDRNPPEALTWGTVVAVHAARLPGTGQGGPGSGPRGAKGDSPEWTASR